MKKILNCSGTIPKASPAPMSDSDILATHNAYRIAVGEDPLVWSTELASYAQDWANYLVANNLFEHSYGLYGENLAAGPLTDSQLVDLWGAEKQYFKCGTFPDVSTTGNWRDVGHYTQMIWPDTEECGCGIASSSTYPYSKVLVCEYNPPGNFIGQYICPSNAYPNKPSIPSGPASGVAGTAYSYSTSATDPDGNQVKYTFDWGDGTTSVTSLVNSGTSSNASHTWSAAGTYLVKAMATDSIGATSGWSNTLSVTITVPNRVPNSPSIPSGPASGVAGTAYSYSTSATDPDGNQVKYTFDWGDGTTSVTSLVNSGTSANASHTWSAAGTYLVKAKAADSIGATSGWSNTLSVTITAPNSAPNSPSIPSGPASGISGTAYSYSTSATDPDGNQVKYTFDWGDGTTSVTSLVNSGTAANASHTWGAAGTYLVKAMATDSIGATSGWSNTLSVTITGPNRAPNSPSIPSGPASGVAGNAYSYSTSATDPDGNQVKYIFDWGDGTTSETSLVNSGTAASASHTWGAAGTYLVKAMATDSLGATSGWSNTLSATITAPNRAPNSPSIPSGPASGVAGNAYSYSTSATDPDGNQVKYTFDWGDGTTSETSLVNSGTAASASHTWGAAGTYLVKAMATDSIGAASAWSNQLAINISQRKDDEWEKDIGGSGDQYGHSVQQTTDGGYIVTGNSIINYVQRVYLAKTDASGNVSWEKIHGSASCTGRAVRQTQDQGYIVAGTIATPGSNGIQIYLLKTDANGDKQWENNFGGIEHDEGNAVQQTIDGGYIVVGEKGNGGDFSQVYLVKTDALGNKEWEKFFGTTGKMQEFLSNRQQTMGS